MSKQIKRIEDIQLDVYSYKTKCLNCGKPIELYWNGGELDEQKCCGYTYSLQHAKLDFVVWSNS